MKRIAIVETDARGGLVHFAYHMADALAAKGCDVTLITGRDYELGDLPHRFKVAPILKLWPQFDRGGAGERRGGFRGKLRRAGRGLVLVREWGRLTLYLVRLRPDVAVFSIIRFAFLGVFLAMIRRSGIELAQVCHEFRRRDLDPGVFDGLETRWYEATYRRFGTIFFLSRAVRDEFSALYDTPARICLLPHPPQTLLQGTAMSQDAVRAKLGIGPQDRVVLFFGLLRPSKGVDFLVEAFSRLASDPDLRLVICGYPSKQFDTDGLVDLAKRLGVAERTTFFFDYLPNQAVAPLLSLSEAVVFPYRNASASGALALAQSLGRPVVVTDVSGLAEVVEHGVTGRVAPVDDPGALATEIQWILDNPGAAAAMGAAARNLFDRERSWSVLSDRVLDALDGDAAAAR